MEEREPPDLEDGPLPAGGAAQQVGEHRGGEDEGRRAQAQGLVLPHSHQDEVGAPVLLHAANPVEQNNGHAPQGQEPQKPRVGLPQGGNGVQRVIKGSADPAGH